MDLFWSNVLLKIASFTDTNDCVSNFYFSCYEPLSLTCSITNKLMVFPISPIPTNDKP